METSHIDNDITVMTNVPNVRLVFAFTDICYTILWLYIIYSQSYVHIQISQSFRNLV